MIEAQARWSSLPTSVPKPILPPVAVGGFKERDEGEALELGHLGGLFFEGGPARDLERSLPLQYLEWRKSNGARANRVNGDGWSAAVGGAPSPPPTSTPPYVPPLSRCSSCHTRAAP